jgi:lipopolysaccharide/colanic/teichoic acid biosynthesis glycosyltransferase
LLKRAFDVAASTAGLLILWPFLLVIALIVKLSSPGPALYRASRVGRYGVPFGLLKFRSMVADADQIGPGITAASDARITPIGRVLRGTKLDELPQLINVLRGEMSLVGPRPEDPRYVALYTEAQRQVLNVRPGITSLASVQYRHEESLLTGEAWETHYIEQVMPEKLAIELEYVKRATFRDDILVVLATLRAIVT